MNICAAHVFVRGVTCTPPKLVRESAELMYVILEDSLHALNGTKKRTLQICDPQTKRRDLSGPAFHNLKALLLKR